MESGRSVLVLTLLLLASACTSTSGTEPADSPSATFPVGVSVPSTSVALVSARDVVIRDRAGGLGQQSATVYEPHVDTSSSPTVVVLHGAGGPTREQYSDLAKAIAEMGVVVVNADWLASVSKPKESVGDAVCAVAFAEELGHWTGESQEDQRVIVVGHSGGGHVGMLASLAPEAFSDWCDVSSIGHTALTRVWAYVGLAGDPAAATEGGNVHRFWLDDSDVLAAMDGYSYLGGNQDLIVRFVHGSDDTTVLPERTRAFHVAMVAAGYDSKFTQIDSVNHFGIVLSENRVAREKVLAVIAELIAQGP
jgi:dienelactone hydrolase